MLKTRGHRQLCGSWPHRLTTLVNLYRELNPKKAVSSATLESYVAKAVEALQHIPATALTTSP